MSNNCEETLFGHGRIYLVRDRYVRANCGIPALHGLILGGALGFEVDTSQEYYVCFVNRRQNQLLIFHQDEAGYTLIKRVLHARNFDVLMTAADKAITITRQQLRRLVLDGTYHGEFESVYLKQELEKLGAEEPLKKAS